jgi:hypothetical protein
MKKMTHATITLIATLAVLLAAVDVAQAVNYQEDFSGAGSTLSDFGYAPEGIVGGGNNTIATSGVLNGTRKVVGPGSMRISHGVDFTGENNVFYEFDAILPAGDVWAGITTPTCCNNEGIMFGTTIVDFRKFENSQTGVLQPVMPGITGQTPYHFRMDYDRSNLTIDMVVTPEGGGATVGSLQFAVDPADADVIDLLTTFYIQTAGASGAALEVDNIVVGVGVIPEPTSLLLLSIGTLGLVVSSRRRRMR